MPRGWFRGCASIAGLCIGVKQPREGIEAISPAFDSIGVPYRSNGRRLLDPR